jgi:hypothetical protein
MYIATIEYSRSSFFPEVGGRKKASIPYVIVEPEQRLWRVSVWLRGKI